MQFQLGNLDDWKRDTTVAMRGMQYRQMIFCGFNTAWFICHNTVQARWVKIALQKTVE